MPTGATGTTITLGAMYTDGAGAPEVPTDPLVAIIDPSDNVLVSGGVPTAGDDVGEYTYDYDIPAAGPTGTWTILWLGEINDAPIEGSTTFLVVGGSIIFPSTECPASPMWATAEEFIALYPESSTAEAEDAIMEATWMLWSLTGKQYHDIECREDDYQSRPGLCRIRLYHQPVEEVFTVVRVDPCDDEETAVDDWCYLPGGSVRVCCSPGGYYGPPVGGYGHFGYNPYTSISQCRCDDGVVRIQYQVASNLPPGASRNVLKLAREFWKSSHGQACALPERITNVTRQGVTWITLDPLDFLDKGLTGIGSIDQWIAGVNLRGNATLIDPLEQPRLLTSTLTGCGETCEAV